MRKINIFLSLIVGVIILLNCIVPTISIATIDIIGSHALISPNKLLREGSGDTVDPTQWVAVDGLGRTLKTNDDVGAVKSDKEVGILFWLWHDTETVMYRRDREAMAAATTAAEKLRAFKTFLHKEPINVQERLDAGATTNYNDDKWLRNNSDNQVNNGNKGYCWWNEPIYGYYKNDEQWVLRRQIELLADAGIDFLLLDYSNPSGAPDGPDRPVTGSREPYWENRFSYSWNWKPLFEALEEAKADGINVPKVAFMLSFTDQDKYLPTDSTGNTLPHQGGRGNNEMLLSIYENLYKENEYSDLWYYRDGKPFIMSYKPDLASVQNDSTVSASDKAMLTTINSYFTFRNPGTTNVNAISNTNGPHNDGWLWQSAFPQNYGKSNGKVEEVPVSAAQNLGYISESSSFGRNDTGSSTTGQANSNFTGDYTYKYRGNNITVNSNIQNAVYYGRNFQQQWDRAISLNPEVIVITGWNEWVAVRAPINGENGKNYFVDEYNDERSKDIEPTKGKLKDYYYYQMVDNIRRFKGANKAQKQAKEKTIDITGNVSQWDDSNIISYNHYIRNDYSKDRVAYGWGYEDTFPSTRIPFYKNKTSLYGNDLKKAKVSYDANNIYFYLEVDRNFKYYGINKTRLLIDTVDSKDSTSTANWEEFEFILNRYGATNNKLILERSKGGWDWEQVGTVDYTKSSNVLQVKIPISYLGLTGGTIKFNFKWVDNNITGITTGDREGYPEDGDLKINLTEADVTSGDIMSIYTEGDAAPGGRFAFSFTGQKTYEINYVLNSGFFGSYHPTSANVGATIRISNPTRNGYEFAGWTMSGGDSSSAKYGITSTNVATSWSDPTYKVTAEYFKNLRSNYGQVTLTANWSETTAKLTYDANGHGTAPATVTMKYSTATKAASAITTTGYNFAGWNTKADGSGTNYAAGSQVKAANVIPTAMTLYAKWTEKTAKLTYDANGHGTAPATVTMKYTTQTNASTGITAAGYNFKGWNTKADGTGTNYAAGSQVKSANVEPTAMTLYAQWEEKTAKITYNANGHGTAPAEETMKYSIAANAADAITAAGYTFEGWNTKADGTGTNYVAGSQVKAANVEPKAITLYAKWRGNSYSIAYDYAGGKEGTYAPTSGVYGTVLRISNPTKQGYTFTGWTMTNGNITTARYGDSEDNVTTLWDNANTLVKAEYFKNLKTAQTVTLVAHWEPIQYSITYNLNGGQIRNETTTFNIESEDIRLVRPTKAGYTFKGWSGTDLDEVQKEVTIKKGSFGDKTFDANWEPETYTITYNVDAGIVNNNPTSYTIETKEIKINNPKRVTGWTKVVSKLGWEDGYIFFETGEEGYTDTYPDSHCSGIIYLKEGITYTISGCGDYKLADIRWKLYDLEGNYLGSTLGNIIGGTCTPTQDCLAKILFYKASTEEERNGTIITGSGIENEVIIPTGSTGNIVLTPNITEGYFNILEYEQDNNYIKKINPNTKRVDFEENIETNMSYTIKEKENEVGQEDLIKTGQVIKASDIEYTLVVSGDLNKDGKVTVADLAMIQRKILNPEYVLDEAAIKAGDKNNDGSLTVIDLASIQKYILTGSGL